MLGDVVSAGHSSVFETEAAAVCSLPHQLASALDFPASCQYFHLNTCHTGICRNRLPPLWDILEQVGGSSKTCLSPPPVCRGTSGKERKTPSTPLLLLSSQLTTTHPSPLAELVTILCLHGWQEVSQHSGAGSQGWCSPAKREEGAACRTGAFLPSRPCSHHLCSSFRSQGRYWRLVLLTERGECLGRGEGQALGRLPGSLLGAVH